MPCLTPLPRRAFRRDGLAFCVLLAAGFFAAAPVFANVPGGGTGTGGNVTLTDSGTTVTLANGIVSILCTKSGATINQINYTYNNGSGTTTTQLLNGGYNGGQLYWELGGFGGSTFAYTLVTNTTDYAEISLLSTSATNGTMEVHFSLLRGATGFYVTPIWRHRAGDGAVGMGETRDNIYAGSIFNWMSVDSARNRLMEVSGGAAIGVFNAPKEVSLWTNGLYQGQYEDKYCYSADLGVQRVWGWSSVGSGGKNVGLWNVSASGEYYNGGPMKRELMEHIGTTILNMHNGSHYGGGTDGAWNDGEVWTKIYGPYFIYCNNVANSLTDATTAANALYADAQAQAAAEQTAWPYSWFNNPDYTPASSRGAVSGTMAIADSANPNASAAGLWVGVVQQPVTKNNVYDFQEWMKPYQFWVKTDTNGNFTIPDVIAGANYTLYAFGPGAAGTFQSQAQTGGSAPNTLDIPASPFSVTVTGGATNNLGTVTWTPTRVGPTVFEIGYPNRTGDKFRHGDDYWVGDIGPSAAVPSPIWSKHLAYPIDYPSGLTYTVGQSRWPTDWFYCQPILTDNTGNFNSSVSTINFNLPAAPVGGAQASFYIALSSDYQGPLIIQVNGNNIAGSTGYGPAYSSSSGGSDTTIRQGVHGCYSDNRITFSTSYLHSGQNTITINMRKGGYFANHAMYDYIRLELSGYIPPPPASVAAYAASNSVLLAWPVTPGATSYNILRSTTSGGGFTALASGITGPVCGSGPVNATFLDNTAVNGVNYFYTVRSVNTAGVSASSPQSPAATPSAAIPAAIPAAPTGLTATPGDHAVALTWTAVPGANFYTVQRATIVNNGTGTLVPLGLITLNNAVTATSYTDTTPSNGSRYQYFVTATSTAGTSPSSAPAAAKPVPAPPATPPATFTAALSQSTNITLAWPPVSGAIGYVIQRAGSLNGPYVLLASITETNYTDYGIVSSSTYYYKITAMNSGGVAPDAFTTTRPAAPASLTATGGDARVSLAWPATAGATGYIVMRGATSATATNVIASGVTATNYTDTGVTNGYTYFYAVASIGSSANSGSSPRASATPVSTTPTQLVAAFNGASVTFNWPADHLGWRLVGQTNPPGTGLTANWTTVAGSSTTNQETVLLDATQGSVFFRLVYP